MVFLFCFSTIEAEEMKCSAGKCSGAKEVTKKVLPKPKNKSKNSESEALAPKKIRLKSKNRVTIEQLFNVQTTKVKKLFSSPTQVNYGYVVAKDENRVDVTAWFSGYVKKLYVNKKFQKVRKNQALALVYSPEVYKAKQEYLNAIKFNKRHPSKKMLQSAKIKLTLLGVPQREINAITSQHKASYYTTIYSPIAGWVFEKNINLGSSFNNKKRLFEIVNLDEVWVEVKLFQEDLKKFISLDNFKIKVKGVNKTFIAKKELLYPMLNPQKATLSLRLSVKNRQGLLKVGMYSKILSSSTSKSRLVIPKSSVIRKSGEWYVFLATEFKGIYEPIRVSIQPLNRDYYEVLSGLKEDEVVVNNALFMMDSDAQINSLY